MNKTIITVAIIVLGVVALCLGGIIIATPDPVEPAPVDIHTDNSLVEKLGIERPNKKTERLFAIKTYQGDVNTKDIVEIAQIGGMEYIELDPRANDYLLVVPFEVGGKLSVSQVVYDDYLEEYVVPKNTGDDSIYQFKANNGENVYDYYSLLIRYSRPDTPEFQIKLIQDNGEQTATYNIINKEAGEAVKTTQFVIDDVQAGTHSIGEHIVLEDAA